MKQLSVGHNLVADTKTTVYTVPTGYYALWNLCYATNATVNNAKINVWWYDASQDVEIKIIENYTISPGQYLKFDGGAYVVLEAGDEIRMKSELGSTMSAVNTFELSRRATNG